MSAASGASATAFQDGFARLAADCLSDPKTHDDRFRALAHQLEDSALAAEVASGPAAGDTALDSDSGGSMPPLEACSDDASSDEDAGERRVTPARGLQDAAGNNNNSDGSMPPLEPCSDSSSSSMPGLVSDESIDDDDESYGSMPSLVSCSDSDSDSDGADDGTDDAALRERRVPSSPSLASSSSLRSRMSTFAAGLTRRRLGRHDDAPPLSTPPPELTRGAVELLWREGEVLPMEVWPGEEMVLTPSEFQPVLEVLEISSRLAPSPDRSIVLALSDGVRWARALLHPRHASLARAGGPLSTLMMHSTSAAGGAAPVRARVRIVTHALQARAPPSVSWWQRQQRRRRRRGEPTVPRPAAMRCLRVMELEVLPTASGALRLGDSHDAPVSPVALFAYETLAPRGGRGRAHLHDARHHSSRAASQMRHQHEGEEEDPADEDSDDDDGGGGDPLTWGGPPARLSRFGGGLLLGNGVPLPPGGNNAFEAHALSVMMAQAVEDRQWRRAIAASERSARREARRRAIETGGGDEGEGSSDDDRPQLDLGGSDRLASHEHRDNDDNDDNDDHDDHDDDADDDEGGDDGEETTLQHRFIEAAMRSGSGGGFGGGIGVGGDAAFAAALLGLSPLAMPDSDGFGDDSDDDGGAHRAVAPRLWHALIEEREERGCSMATDDTAPDTFCAICLDPLSSSSSSSSLPICLDPPCDNGGPQRIATVRACGHAFHSDCIRAWLERRAATRACCPVCRCDLTTSAARGAGRRPYSLPD